MNVNRIDKDNIYILKTKKLISNFINHIKKIVESSNNIFASLDFEFDRDFKNNKHILSLVQLVIDYDSQYENENRISEVYIMDFRLFTKKQMSEFINYILLNSKVLKIMHGSESLDLPAIHSLFSTNSNAKFKIYVNQMIDTRHLCETYITLSNRHHNTSYTKCNIYSALLMAGIIDETEYSNLNSIKINYNKPWNIFKLTEKQIIYAVSDVMFIRRLYIEYQKLLGDTALQISMDAFRYAVFVNMNIISSKYYDNSRNTKKLKNIITELNSKNILQNILATTPIGDLTIGDLCEISYIRKSLIMLLSELFIQQ